MVVEDVGRWKWNTQIDCLLVVRAHLGVKIINLKLVLLCIFLQLCSMAQVQFEAKTDSSMKFN